MTAQVRSPLPGYWPRRSRPNALGAGWHDTGLGA